MAGCGGRRGERDYSGTEGNVPVSCELRPATLSDDDVAAGPARALFGRAHPT